MDAPPAPATAPGTLYLVPAPLDFGAEPVPLDSQLPLGTLRAAARLTHWVCENARSARAYLKRIAAAALLALPLQAQHMVELPRAVHKHGDHVGAPAATAPRPDWRRLLEPAMLGHDMGLLCEAGLPAVADPGSALVREAHALGLRVVPLVGPASLLLALAASGLNGQQFAFVGYLPQDAAERSARIRALEAHALRTGQAQIVIETPYRNAALLQALLHTLAPATQLAVCSGLTLPQAATSSAPVSRWRHAGAGADGPRLQAPDARTPAVFVFGR